MKTKTPPSSFIEQPITSKRLPEHCYLAITTEPEWLVLITRGELGYKQSTYRRDTHVRNVLNKRFGATPAHVMAMTIGSMRGWHVPGAQHATWTKTFKNYTDRLDF